MTQTTKLGKDYREFLHAIAGDRCNRTLTSASCRLIIFTTLTNWNKSLLDAKPDHFCNWNVSFLCFPLQNFKLPRIEPNSKDCFSITTCHRLHLYSRMLNIGYKCILSKTKLTVTATEIVKPQKIIKRLVDQALYLVSLQFHFHFSLKFHFSLESHYDSLKFHHEYNTTNLLSSKSTAHQTSWFGGAYG